jgi:ribosome maturation factor RimP
VQPPGTCAAATVRPRPLQGAGDPVFDGITSLPLVFQTGCPANAAGAAIRQDAEGVGVRAGGASQDCVDRVQEAGPARGLAALARGASPAYMGRIPLSELDGGWPAGATFFVGRLRETERMTERDPASILTNDDDLPQHEGLEARIATSILPSLRQMGYELVRVQVSGKERPVVQIMADRADGATFRVEDCEAISHTAGAVLDVEDPIRGEWTLEVSSAGIDRPLTRIKDWNRYAGHLATLELAVPQDGRKRFRGVALGADAEAVRLRLEDGTEESFPRGNIRRAKLVLTDELIAATAADAKRN